jgi:alcohol dehydrogenase (cytochrome c)
MEGRGTTPASQLESLIADSDTIATTRLRDYSPVSDEMRRQPPDADWLVWRRTLDNLGYSPLDQINRDSVKNLKLAWRQPLAPGNSMATPFVHNGVMFLYSAGDVLMALDASNGELLWRYRHVGTEVTDSKFGVALYEGLVLVPTSDLHLVALDARSGAVVWDHAIRYDGSGG